MHEPRQKVSISFSFIIVAKLTLQSIYVIFKEKISPVAKSSSTKLTNDRGRKVKRFKCSSYGKAFYCEIFYLKIHQARAKFRISGRKKIWLKYFLSKHTMKLSHSAPSQTFTTAIFSGTELHKILFRPCFCLNKGAP